VFRLYRGEENRTGGRERDGKPLRHGRERDMFDWETINYEIMRRFPQYTFEMLYRAPLKLVYWLYRRCPDET
jgi:hypothetical protein